MPVGLVVQGLDRPLDEEEHRDRRALAEEVKRLTAQLLRRVKPDAFCDGSISACYALAGAHEHLTSKSIRD